MKLILNYQIALHCVIALGLCFGGWLMIVKPMTDELHQVDAAIAQAQANPMLTDPQAVERMADQLEQARSRIGRIELLNSMAQDSSQLYSQVMTIAQEQGVEVQRLDPGSNKNVADAARPVHVATLRAVVLG